MTSVSSHVGYVYNSKNTLYSFIIANDTKNAELEEKIIKIDDGAYRFSLF